MSGLIAVHVGAGYHAESKRKSYKDTCKRACKVATDMLRQKSFAVDVVSEAVACLEDCDLTNAGIGSNLTLNGMVECDSGIMDGKSLNFGSVGAVYNIKNPVKLARSVLSGQCAGLLSHGRIPPCTLVGKGALQWAVSHGFDCIDTSSLITKHSQSAYQKNLLLLNSNTDNPIEEGVMTDTVGAVCVDAFGNVAAAVSSGGLLLKHSGRVGQAAVFGAGCWAKNDHHLGIAVSASGVGEYLIRTLFAKECYEGLFNSPDTLTALPNVFKDKLVESPYLSGIAAKPAGVLAVVHNSEEISSEIVWAHTTRTFVIGYMSANHDKPHCIFSKLPPGTIPGVSIVSSSKTV